MNCAARNRPGRIFLAAALGLISRIAAAEPPARVAVEGQPLAANVARVIQALDSIGAPLPAALVRDLGTALKQKDVDQIQSLLDSQVSFVVEVNPESRVKVRRGPGSADLQQGGYTALLVKVLNQGMVSKELRISSAQAGPVYAGMTRSVAERMLRVPLKEYELKKADPSRFIEVEMLTRSPMTTELSGLEAEYAIALVYSSEAGRREATIGFDVGQGTQDIGFRAEVPVLFNVRPAVKVTVRIHDFDGQPTTARLQFTDSAGHVFPPQAKRLAPDFFFQNQIYRNDGESVLLPPGRLTLTYGRGPEYRVLRRDIEIPPASETTIDLKLERWINPTDYGFYGGDHHIHGGGCAHYTDPTDGVSPQDIFNQVKGEGLYVGCILTWGPCFDYQRQFFSPHADRLSEPFAVIKYDLEISGFGSSNFGHLCLLNLKDQEYPGSEGTKDKGWPHWTVPILRWAKAQGAHTGFAHSGSGLEVNPAAEAKRILAQYDANHDSLLTKAEAANALLPEPFEVIDRDGDRAISESELADSLDRVADQLPNLANPDMNSGAGAKELCVAVAHDVCDFVSAMNTARIVEWNLWYHILNCGFPLKVSGETDFPCISSDRVGHGRVYVQLGKVDKVDFPTWCEGLARGRSYVSDGYAHALEFSVNGVRPGFGNIDLTAPGEIEIKTKVAFAAEQPLNVQQGGIVPPGGVRIVGDAIFLHAPRTNQVQAGGKRKVEIVVNGRAVAAQDVDADGRVHSLTFRVPIERSSWVALREFPQLHTNPVDVRVSGKPIRVSRQSARWCIEVIEQVWRNRSQRIPEAERPLARAAYDQAIARYRAIALESPE